MTDEEMNTAVALALGRKTFGNFYENYCGVRLLIPEFSTNLNRAIDRIVPVLNEMGYRVEFFAFAGRDQAVKASGFEVEAIEVHSYSGSTPSNRLANALCQVFLSIAKDQPEKLKEALKRMAA